MNYLLLFTVGSLLAGLFGMERWCSWRLNVSQRRRRPSQVPPPHHVSKVASPENIQAQVAAVSKLPAQT